MLEVRLNGQNFTYFNSFSLELELDSVASSFSLDLYFDPENPEHRKIFKPGGFAEVQVLYKQETLITGYVLNKKLVSTNSPELVSVNGYSKPGILEDTAIPVSAYPLQFSKQSLEDIAAKVLSEFPIEYEISPEVKADAAKKYDKVEANQTDSIKSFLAGLASQRGILLSNTPEGKLLFTRVGLGPSVALLDGEGAATGFELSIDDQGLHSDITVTGQQDVKGGNSRQSTVKNPFVSQKRYKISNQSSGDTQDTKKAAENKRADELRSIELSGNLDTWLISDKVMRPGDIIRVREPRLLLSQAARFILTSVTLSGGVEPETATFKAVLPEVYTQAEPQSPFDE
jgi:prophage tail gpP-like protein